MEKQEAKHTFGRLRKRLTDAGLSPEFIQTALLPDWWTKDCDKEPGLLPEFEITVARFLKTSVADIRNPFHSLVVPSVSAQLRIGNKSMEPEALSAAIYAANAVAHALVRNLRPDFPTFKPFTSAQEFRDEILATGTANTAVTLKKLCSHLLSRGVVVARLETLPRPKFRGMACMVGDRPVILLGSRADLQPPFLHDLAHEAGHIAHGHVTNDRPTVDVEDNADSSDSNEKEANVWGRALLFGASCPSFYPPNPVSNLALLARDFGRVHRVDSGILVHYWAQRSKNYSACTRALEVLQKTDAKEVLRAQLEPWINVEEASQTDASLLRCAFPCD